MTPLAAALMLRRPRLTPAGAEHLAAKIMAEKSERLAKKKAEREREQFSINFAGTATRAEPEAEVDF